MSLGHRLDRSSWENDVDIRDRVGVLFDWATATDALEVIAAVARDGVRQVWKGTTAMSPDSLTIFAAAAVKTNEIRLGTSIVPAYPRHPCVMAQQALAIDDLAPGRLRLGIGPGGRGIIKGAYGLSMRTPLAHLREYTMILRTLLHEGSVDVQGRFFTVSARIPRIAPVPVLISAIREHMFELAGEVADGAISYMCPVPYLLNTALPALQRGAKAADRPVPPLIAHVPVAMSEDRTAVLAAGRAEMRFYAGQLASLTGVPVNGDGSVPDELVENLMVSGTEEMIRQRLQDLLANGLDELMLTLVPIADKQTERTRLTRLIGSLENARRSVHNNPLERL